MILLLLPAKLGCIGTLKPAQPWSSDNIKMMFGWSAVSGRNPITDKTTNNAK
jgi:hypothetical protein